MVTGVAAPDDDDEEPDGVDEAGSDDDELDGVDDAEADEELGDADPDDEPELEPVLLTEAAVVWLRASAGS